VGSEHKGRKGQRLPSGFFYDRLIPLVLGGLGVVLLAVVLLSVAAMLGLIPAG
jgi:hypothetical protein